MRTASHPAGFASFGQPLLAEHHLTEVSSAGVRPEPGSSAHALTHPPHGPQEEMG